MVRLRLDSPAGFRSSCRKTARRNTFPGTVYGLPVWGIHIALVCFLVVYKEKERLNYTHEHAFGYGHAVQ